MCVAAVIDSKSGPTLRELRAMEDENPHGCGIAYASGDRIRYTKGLTADMVYRLQASLPRPYLLHFRWATHGPKVQHLCHPFPLGPSALMSRRVAGTAPAVLIHNGVWGNYRKHLPKWARKMERELSDTAVAAFAADKDESILDEVAWATVVARAAGRGRMDLTIRGDTWREHNGDLYSNLRWLPGQSFLPPRRYSRPVMLGGASYGRDSHEAVAVDIVREQRRAQRQLDLESVWPASDGLAIDDPTRRGRTYVPTYYCAEMSCFHKVPTSGARCERHREAELTCSACVNTLCQGDIDTGDGLCAWCRPFQMATGDAAANANSTPPDERPSSPMKSWLDEFEAANRACAALIDADGTATGRR